MAKNKAKKKDIKSGVKVELVIYGADGKKIVGIMCASLLDCVEVIFGLLGVSRKG